MERRNSGKFLNARYWSCYILFNFFVIAAFSLTICKAFQLQVWEHSAWVERARNQAETTFPVPTYRGSIYDRQGRLMSYSVPQRSLFADCDQVENPKRMVRQLASVLGEPEATIDKKLVCNRHFVWLKRHLTDQQAVAVENMKSRGLNLVDEYKRFYPYRQVGGQILGFVGMDGTGLEGIEKSFDRVLRENSKNVGQLRDGVKKTLWLGNSTLPEPGESYGVKLTLDAFLQYVCERELEKAVLQYRAKAGEVVLVDAQTSEVLAMANWPFFDPNLSDKRNADSWRNRTVTDSFEPGSTFKVFLVSGALDEGIIKEKDRIFCENGRYNLAGHTVKDVHPYGWLTISDVIKYSSNIASGKLALQLGRERYYRYIKAFGFGSSTSTGLPGEVKGLLRSYKRWRPMDLATTGFGQSIGVTALQLTMGVSTLANGGIYTAPIVAKEIVDSDGQTVKKFEAKPLRRAIQEKTARQICDMMKTVTEEGGTGVKAAPEGYTVAGKTGTAQVLDRATRRYASNKFTSIFTGFIPADRPRLVMTVVIHEPQGAIYGGVVAAPVFRGVSEKALPYLGVPPHSDALTPSSEPRQVKAHPRDATKTASHAKKDSRPGLGNTASGAKTTAPSRQAAPPEGPVKGQKNQKIAAEQYPPWNTPKRSGGVQNLALSEAH